MKENKLKWQRLKNRATTCRGSLAWLGRQTHNLAKNHNQMRNLEFARGKRLQPEVAGSNPAPETELASVSVNGTNSTLDYPNKSLAFSFDNTIDNKYANFRPPQNPTKKVMDENRARLAKLFLGVS